MAAMPASRRIRVPGAGALFIDDRGAARRITLAGAPPGSFEPYSAAAIPVVSTVRKENEE